MLHQGKKFVKRFDANTYLRIADMWLRYDPLRDAGVKTYEELFARSAAAGQHYLVFSIDSDFCFYPEEQAELVSISKKPRSRTCTSPCTPTKATTPSCSNPSSTPRISPSPSKAAGTKAPSDRRVPEVE
jgi:hypothetical protein